METQLRLATASFGSFGQAQQDVGRIANATRNGLTETSTLYGNFIRASAAMGKTQDEAARATETFSKALKIGGAGAAEAASATLQFGQALASGVLRGDEFNSIAEASPRILKLLADSLGVSTGALRSMAAEGKLTADVLYTALTDRKFTAGIDAEFQQLPKTFDEAMTLVDNAAVETFGAFDRGGQFSTAIANFVSDGSDGFGRLADRAEWLGREVRSALAGLANVWDGFVDAGESAIERIRRKFGPLLYGLDQLNNAAADLNPLNFVGRAIIYNGWAQDRYTEGRDQQRNTLARDQALQDIQDRFGGAWFRRIIGEEDAPPSAAAATPAKRARRAARPKLTGPTEAPLGAAVLDAGSVPLASGEYDPIFGRDVPATIIERTELLARLEAGLKEIQAVTGQIDIGAILKAEDQQRLLEFEADFGRDLTRSLADAVVYGDNLGDVLENTFKRAAAALLESGLLELLSPGSAGGGTWRGFIGKAGSIFSGLGFANGGSPPVGKASLVGERGPELFIPRVPGVVVPNHMLGDWGSTVQVQQSFSVNAQGAVLAADLMSEMRSIGVRAAAGGAALAQQQIGRRSRQALR
ncbi:tape measure protein [Edaphosphingomonas haloaromaticamans]|nr:tape measure protein [Sphingomonas haloaromaticamans]